MVSVDASFKIGFAQNAIFVEAYLNILKSFAPSPIATVSSFDTPRPGILVGSLKVRPLIPLFGKVKVPKPFHYSSFQIFPNFLKIPILTIPLVRELNSGGKFQAFP